MPKVDVVSVAGKKVGTRDLAPEVFEVRDDDFLYVLDETPPEALRPKVEEAVRRCPKQAISIVEE